MGQIDDRLFLAMNRLAEATPWMNGPAEFFADYGVVLFAALLVAGVWSARRSSATRVAAALWAPVGVLVAFAAAQPLGTLIGERRPYDVLPGILVLTHRTTDFSFPSDHSIVAGATAAGLYLVSRRLGHLASVAAVLMALTRVYVAAHFPWDVVAGLAFGAGVTLILWLLLRGPLVAVVGRLSRRRAVGRLLGT